MAYKRQEEFALQRACVGYVKSATDLMILEINNNNTSAKAGAAAKRMGLHTGASDTVLILPRGIVAWIEFKRPERMIRNLKTGNLNKRAGGKQSVNQKDFEAQCIRLGHWYYLIDDYNNFVQLVNKLVDSALQQA